MREERGENKKFMHTHTHSREKQMTERKRSFTKTMKKQLEEKQETLFYSNTVFTKKNKSIEIVKKTKQT